LIIELLGFISLIGLGAGCWLVYEPLGLIVPSALLFVVCCLAARNR